MNLHQKSCWFLVFCLKETKAAFYIQKKIAKMPKYIRNKLLQLIKSFIISEETHWTHIFCAKGDISMSLCEQCNCCACPEFSLCVCSEPFPNTALKWHHRHSQTEAAADQTFSVDWAGNQTLSRSFVLQCSWTKGNNSQTHISNPQHQFWMGFGSVSEKKRSSGWGKLKTQRVFVRPLHL